MNNQISELKQLFPKKKRDYISYIIYVGQKIEGDILYFFFSGLGLSIQEGDYENYTKTGFFDICYSGNSIFINCAFWHLILANQARLNSSHTFKQFKNIVSKSEVLAKALKEAETKAIKNEEIKNDYRKHNWLERPVYGELQSLWTKNYFKELFDWYKKTQKRFCQYLEDINKLLKNTNVREYSNLILFTEGNPNARWVSTKKSLFDVFTKLFDGGVSPERAIEYIDNCYTMYKSIIENRYVIDDEYVISNRISAWSGRVGTFITTKLKPLKELTDHCYWLDITFNSCVVDEQNACVGSSCDIEVDVNSKDDLVCDSLGLFNYDRNDSFYKKMLWTAVEQLRKKNIVVRGVYCKGNYASEYSYNNMWPVVGRHKINDK